MTLPQQQDLDLRRLEGEVNHLCRRYGEATRYPVTKVAPGAPATTPEAGHAPNPLETLNAVLRESEKRYRTLFDLSPVAVYSIDAAGVIEQFNIHAAELWGRVPVLGDTYHLFCGSYKMFLPDGTDLPHHRCPMATVVSGEVAEARDAEVVVERPDGSRITVIVNIVPLKNEEGEITGAINCFYDITERSRLERKTKEQGEALADLHHRKDEFLAMLSHELRNPLAPIASAVQLLRLQKNEDPKQREVRNIIERQVAHLVHIIDDLMEISRITSGKIHLQQERIAIGEVVERALETTRPLIVERRHELTVSLPPQPVWVHADPVRLVQVVVNLLNNAAKYTEEGGHLWLTVRQDGGMMELEVRDSGIGMPPELLPHVFGLFTQADRSLDRAQGGLGIGLSLVQKIVELHGGSVKASSVLGHSSEFVVRMPAMLAALPALPRASVEAEDLPAESCRVLVVDDNLDAAQTLKMLLEADGHEVRVVHDGSGALEAVLDDRPDVVLLDIGLPGLSGFEVAKAIRKQPMLDDVVLVAITGYGLETDRKRSRDAGFKYHLVKPTDFTEVQKILASCRTGRARVSVVAPAA